MRHRVSALCLTAAAVAGLGCSQTRSAAPAPQPAPVPGPAPLVIPGELHGRPLVHRDDGAWSYRVSGRAGASGGLRTESGVAEAEFDMGASAEARAPAAEKKTEGLARTRRPSAPATGGGAAGPLRAGSTDDNADYDAYLAFLTEWRGRDLRGGYDDLDVRDRRYVRVVDPSGAPVPGATVAVIDEAADAVLMHGTTYGDGRVPFYPHLDGEAADGAQDQSTKIVEARIGDQRVRANWDGGDDLVLHLEKNVAATDTLRLDVLFLIDTTGSMGDEIASIKGALLAVTTKLRSLEREFDLRYGAVLFRDVGDEYVTAKHDFTSDIEAFDAALKGVGANGGGDGPESVNQGLAVAINDAEWRDGAAKVCFLIGDAPPHMDYEGDVSYGRSARAAVAKGIRVHSVAASGLDPRGTLVFRQIAQFTRGKFVFVEYGSAAASASSHGVTGKVKSNNLDDILFEQIRDELAHWGRPDDVAVAGTR